MSGPMILDVFVPGTPKPKGSLRHVGHGRMIEQLAGSPDWRSTVRYEAHKMIRCCPDPTCAQLRDGYPNPVALDVEVTVYFVKPKSAPKNRVVRPITRSSGDIDKHARNLLDALVDAGVMRDDSQVVDLTIRKRYDAVPGAYIRVREHDERTPGGAAAAIAGPVREQPTGSVA